MSENLTLDNKVHPQTITNLEHKLRELNSYIASERRRVVQKEKEYQASKFNLERYETQIKDYEYLLEKAKEKE